jgi:cytochrome c-type biogenesis protein
MLEEVTAGQVTLFSVWLLGASMGMTACTVTCMPFMGTWVLGHGGSRIEAFAHTSAFLGGRILAYTLLGTMAGAAGLGLAKALGGGMGNIAIGFASVIAGLWLLARPASSCGAAAAAAQPIRFTTAPPARDALPPVLLGAALSLTPCTPLASLLGLAASAGDAGHGAAFGLAFGLGAAVTPILILVPLAGYFGRQLRRGQAWLARWLKWGGALVLILLGLRRFAAAADFALANAS